jgi:hypothetical protein
MTHHSTLLLAVDNRPGGRVVSAILFFMWQS